MHCVSTILKTQMNRITNSNRCRIIRQLWECSNVTISQSWIAALSLSHVAMYLTCTCTDSTCTSIGGVFKRYHFTVLDCRTVTVSCGNVSHIPVPTVHPFGEWLDITFSQSWMPHCHCHMWQCILHAPVPTVRQWRECWQATISQSWMAALWYRTCTSVLRASRCAGVSTQYLYSMPQYINWGSVWEKWLVAISQLRVAVLRQHNDTYQVRVCTCTLGCTCP